MYLITRWAFIIETSLGDIEKKNSIIAILTTIRVKITTTRFRAHLTKRRYSYIPTYCFVFFLLILPLSLSQLVSVRSRKMTSPVIVCFPFNIVADCMSCTRASIFRHNNLARNHLHSSNENLHQQRSFDRNTQNPLCLLK